MGAQDRKAMKYQDKGVRLIEDLVKHHDELDKQFKAIEGLVGADTEAPFFKAMWLAMEAYADVVSEVLGDQDFPSSGSWISWYIWENDCGRRGLSAGVGAGRMRRIKCAKDLLRLIRETNGTWDKKKSVTSDD